MKIRKVKIQAFKSYLKEKDSTFDFSWLKDSSQVANLVSIYAPNGFGKTSFYDAVDYCYTKNITRYIRDDKIRVQNKKNATRQSFIIRNRNADNEIEQLDTKVSIETADEIVFNSPVIVHSHKGADYKFDKDNTPENRKYFRDLMLSQEAIDSFLRETNPVDRFKKFATKQVNDLSLLNEKRMTISQLLADIETNLREIRSQEHEKMCELVLIDTDKDILEKINKSIVKCNAIGVKLDLISKSYDLSTHQSLIMSITEAFERTNSDKIELDEKVRLSNSFINDSKKLHISAKEMKVLNKDLEQLRALLSTLKLISKKNKLIKQYNEEKEVLELNFTKVNSFYLRNEEFYKLHNKKVSLVKSKSIEGENNTALQSKSEIASKEIEAIRRTISQQSEQRNTDEKLQNNVELLFNKIKLVLEEKTLISTNLKKLKSKIVSAENKIVACDDAKNVLSSFSINSFFEPNSLVINIDELNVLHNQFKKNSGSNRSIDFKIKENNTELEQLKFQEGSVSKLISISYELINKNKSTDCPLCSHPYKDFDDLKSAIEGNKIIDSLSEKILKELSSLNEEKSKLSFQNKKLITDYQSIISKQLDRHLSVKQAAETELLIINKDESEFNSKFLILEEQHTALKSETLMMSKESLREHLFLKIQKSVNDISENKLKINVIKQELVRFNELQKPLNISINKSYDEINSIELNTFYQSFTNYCDEQFIDINEGDKSTKNELKVLQEDISAKLDTIFSNVTSEKALKKELESKTPTKLTHFSKEQVTDFIVKNELSEKEIREDFTRYCELFKEDTYYWLDLERAHAEVNSALEKAKSDSELVQQKHSNLQLLRKLAEEASSLSEGIKLQNELNTLEVDREGLSKLQTVMKVDIDLIDSEIKNYIDDYFYVDLINELYNSIDPHPEFKSIKFEYVSNKSPELHIKVKGEADRDTVAPALHFSSAQINVLSLSIFLAKALNTKSNDGEPANCIFIDDPVQSMYAINVLSIIDLLRNISVRFNKQLIISTHDENFHELLKKKMPSNLFKSKFLKLESFGKVAIDE